MKTLLGGDNVDSHIITHITQTGTHYVKQKPEQGNEMQSSKPRLI